MTFTFVELAWAISAARSDTLLLDTAPDRMIASSVALTWMSSPGKSSPQLLLEHRDGGLDDQVVVLSLGAAPHNQADRARCLAINEDFARLDDHRVRYSGVRDSDSSDLEIGTNDRRSSGSE